MRTVYKVTVEAMGYDDDGNFVRSETLFDASHHRPEALLRFASVEVDSALEEVAGEGVPAAEQHAGLGRAVATPETSPTTSEATAPEMPAKRKRRTKAEIEAEKAAALASQTGADPSPENQEALASVAPTAAPVAEQAPPTATPAVAPPAVATPPGDGQWNPFLSPAK